MPLGVSQFLHQVLARGRFLFWISPTAAWITAGALSRQRIQGLLRLIKERVSLFRLFITAVLHLHPSEGLCASGFASSLSPPNLPNLHGMSPQLSSSSLSPQLYGREEREGRKRERESKIHERAASGGNRTHATTDFVPDR